MNDDRQERLEELEAATKRLQDEEAAKKRDSKIHSENVKAIKDEIGDIMDGLSQLAE